MNCIINILDQLLILCNDCNAMKSHVIHDRELLYNHLGGGGGGGGVCRAEQINPRCN